MMILRKRKYWLVIHDSYDNDLDTVPNDGKPLYEGQLCERVPSNPCPLAQNKKLYPLVLRQLKVLLFYMYSFIHILLNHNPTMFRYDLL